MKLRQVALAAEHLEPTRANLSSLFGLDADYRDPGVGEFGLENSVMAIGDSFLEIVAPTQPNTSAGRLLARRQQTCGYMILMQVDNFAAFDAHISAQGLRKVWQVERSEVSACHIHPKDIGGAIVSFDEMRPPSAWVWGGPSWQSQKAQHVSRIKGCTVQSQNAANLAARWASAMNINPSESTDGIRLNCDEDTFIDFVAGDTYEGIKSVTLQSPDPAARYSHAHQLGLSSSADQIPSIGGLELHFCE